MKFADQSISDNLFKSVNNFKSRVSIRTHLDKKRQRLDFTQEETCSKDIYARAAEIYDIYIFTAALSIISHGIFELFRKNVCKEEDTLFTKICFPIPN